MRRLVAVFAIGLILASAASAIGAGAQPMEPQPASGNLEPGLSVRYYYGLFRHVDELVEWMAEDKGKAGPFLPALNYHVGAGTVLTSDAEDGVGAHITGLVQLKKPGTYSFAVQSNDGFRLKIGGVQVLEDSGVHYDRYSDIAKVSIERPGWYALSLLYFERKSTSTIELYWKQPGEKAGSLTIVPAAAFARLK